ncbi:MAG TPA: 4Fe-4S dicluster domain-containing protein [Deltaproteobacteria bacterium]|nr:4Fe-4S dicluster domain-containing protein [Deltaproteobacteria bacterium]
MGKEKSAFKPLATGDRTIPPEGAKMISLYIMGREYEVPETLTVLKAVEYAGFRYVRGCGCRGGICGACGTFYRYKGDYRLRTGLACQTVAEQDMIIVQLPFFPANRPDYDLDEMGDAPHERLRSLYPEVFKCVGCGTCTRTCPMDIDVMDYIALMKRGDLKGAALKSFDCVMCGLCASRCPAQISQFTAAMFVRRLYGRYMLPRAEHLKKRVEDVKSGKYEKMLDELRAMKPDDVKKLYVEREREPDLAEPGKWMPQETKYL